LPPEEPTASDEVGSVDDTPGQMRSHGSCGRDVEKHEL
jgi:hypothetical protein